MEKALMKLCLLFYLFYITANISSSRLLNRKLRHSWSYNLDEDDENLIDTTGCTIPNIWKEHQIVEVNDCKNSCGIRAVFIEKIPDDNVIIYTIQEKPMKDIFGNNSYECCFKFAFRLSDDNMAFTDCKPFKNGTRTILLHEVITVTCQPTGNSTKNNIYEDAYIILKKLQIDKIENDKNSWNVLILGMDTMSRARVKQSMPKVDKYFKQNSWLDYRGFQKAASNTHPNLMILLTGKNSGTYHEACKDNMARCNDLMIWSEFKKNGYVTAYGEDHLPDTYIMDGGIKEPPTDHYTRPLFRLGEKELGNIVCLKNKPTAHHVLDYAYQFAKEYKNNKFFGFFWLTTYSHDPSHIPTLLQNQLIQFFEKLRELGTLKNTIIIFLGDHGARYGRLKLPMASYYDERLPMLFMWYPLSFRKRYVAQFNNLKINQHRLTTHCDLHSTLWNILRFSNNSVKVKPPEFCPRCSTLFEEKSLNRRCADMNVSARWCSCHVLDEVQPDDMASSVVPDIILSALKVKFEIDYKIKRILRHHWFRNEYYDLIDDIAYYVIAIEVVQEDRQFEGVVKIQGSQFNILGDIDMISPRDEVDVSHCLVDSNYTTDPT